MAGQTVTAVALSVEGVIFERNKPASKWRASSALTYYPSPTKINAFSDEFFRYVII